MCRKAEKGGAASGGDAGAARLKRDDRPRRRNESCTPNIAAWKSRRRARLENFCLWPATGRLDRFAAVVRGLAASVLPHAFRERHVDSRQIRYPGLAQRAVDDEDDGNQQDRDADSMQGDLETATHLLIAQLCFLDLLVCRFGLAGLLPGFRIRT